MAYRPMSRPDPFAPPRPSDAPISLSGKEGTELEDGLSLAELATALSAHGGGVLSADLALDLVLNEIVEHARLATGATAAAIALTRGDEIVCRATTGSNAPDLGVRLDVDSGLSGACVKSKQWQRCDDSETDSRVDAGICRDLGVRSILVFPVVREEKLLGVFEIFSPRPNAFSDREIQTLQALSRSIVNNVDRAADVLAPLIPIPSVPVLPSSGSEATAEAEIFDPSRVDPAQVDPVQVDPVELDPKQFDHAQHDVALPVAETATVSHPLRRDYGTTVLTLAVIAVALFLGWMMGYVRRPRAPVGTKTRAAVNATSQAVQANPQQDAAATASAVAPDQPASSSATPAAASEQSVSQQSGAALPTGGLVVYENGKVIYRTPSQNSSHSAKDTPGGPVNVPSRVADEYLMLRVEPDYPEPARVQHIEGPVVLEALVGKDGTVEKLSTVSGDAQLATAATDAVRQWRFKPFLRNGSPEEFQTRITVDFRLP
jgi:TonB family protein